MQTNFTPEQLSDPAMAVVGEDPAHLRPLRLLHRDLPDLSAARRRARFSPRGRIYLIKDMLEGGKPATPEVVKHIDRCLSCLSCMTTCPSGVHYMHLVDHARAYIEETYRRPWHDRVLRALLAARAALSGPLPPRACAAALLAQAVRGAARRAAAASATGCAPCSSWRPPRVPAALAFDRPGRLPGQGRAPRPRRDAVAAAPSRC